LPAPLGKTPGKLALDQLALGKLTLGEPNSLAKLAAAPPSWQVLQVLQKWPSGHGGVTPMWIDLEYGESLNYGPLFALSVPS